MKDFTALDRRRRKKAYQRGSESKNQRNGPNLRITNSGNSQSSPNHVKKPLQNLKRCESMVSSSCSIQNPNPNTKSFERNQGNVSKSTTSVNRSESTLFYNDFTQKIKNLNSSNLNHQNSKKFTSF